MNKKQVVIDINNTQYADLKKPSFLTTTNLLDINEEKKETSFNEPFIFKTNKKKSSIKTLRYINNDTGITKHYTPAAQE